MTPTEREPFITMTGREFAGMMRRNRVTIRELAARMNIFMKQIRRRRDVGFGRHETQTIFDYVQAIHGGELPPRYRAASRQLYRWKCEHPRVPCC